MADEDDLDYSDSNVGMAQAQGVRKNISLKLKGKGRGRGRRGGKAKRSSTKKVTENEENEETPAAAIEISSEKHLVDSNLDDVISKLEAPAFSPMDRTFPEPLHQNKKLRWDHKVNLIGEKVIDPLIHCCEKCSLPILNYGRMIPCKHVFCYDCAKKSDKLCSKCDDKVQRIEPSSLGTVFMCTFGGTRHSPGSCGRTYLSQRDLQAHVNHRHLKPCSTAPSTSVPSHTTTVTTTPSAHIPLARDPRDPRSHLQVDVSHQAIMVGHLQHPPDPRETVDHARNAAISLGSPAGQSRQYPHSPASYPSTIPVSSARPNLITVPIQDDGAAHPTGAATAHMSHPQPHVPAYIPSSGTPSHPMPTIPHPVTAYAPHLYPHPTPSSVYSQAPPITTPTFSQLPPPVPHHQPALHQPGTSGGAPIYSTPPPNMVHHPPPSTFPQPRGPSPRPPMHPPPQHHHEGTPSYLSQWAAPPGATVPPTRSSLPPRPITTPPPNVPNANVGLLQPRGPPSDPSYRPTYYQ